MFQKAGKRIKRHTSQRLNLVHIKAQYAEHADLCCDVTKVLSAICLRQLVFLIERYQERRTKFLQFFV